MGRQLPVRIYLTFLPIFTLPFPAGVPGPVNTRLPALSPILSDNSTAVPLSLNARRSLFLLIPKHAKNE